MGVLGLFSDCLSDYFTISSPMKKRKPMQTVELKVKMDCDGCERRVRNALTYIRGVKTVEINRKQSRVKVSGNVDSNTVLKRLIRKTGKKAEFWPYVPYNMAASHYFSQAYDKRAPPGHVKNVLLPPFPNPNVPVENLTTMFSDENPNACSIM